MIGFRPAAQRSQDNFLEGRQLPFNVTKEMVRAQWDKIQSERRWPIVKFTVNGQPVSKVVHPTLEIVDDVLGVIICSRVQVPLISGYAITVHRAQGLTLDKVAVVVDKVFSSGQLYTGLSRGREFLKLKVIGSLNTSFKFASPHVVEFERSTDWCLIVNNKYSLR